VIGWEHQVAIGASADRSGKMNNNIRFHGRENGACGGQVSHVGLPPDRLASKAWMIATGGGMNFQVTCA
jgi:hypothetical protein